MFASVRRQASFTRANECADVSANHAQTSANGRFIDRSIRADLADNQAGTSADSVTETVAGALSLNVDDRT